MSTSIYTKGFHGLQASSCRLQATGGRLQARGNRLQARSNRAARSFRLQARGFEHHVWSLLPGSFRYGGGLSESGDFQLQMLHRWWALKWFFKICGIGKSQWGWPEVLLMLWEGGWEWARLTKSKYISIEVTCPLPLPLPFALHHTASKICHEAQPQASPPSFSFCRTRRLYYLGTCLVCLMW